MIANSARGLGPLDVIMIVVGSLIRCGYAISEELGHSAVAVETHDRCPVELLRSFHGGGGIVDVRFGSSFPH